MSGFFKGFWKFLKVVRSAVGMFFFLVFGLLFILWVWPESTPDIEENSVLLFNPKGQVVEQFTEKRLIETIADSQNGRPEEIRLRDMEAVLKAATKDKNIRAVAIQIDGLEGLPPADAHYLANLLENIKGQGKAIYAHIENHNMNQYIVSSTADEISMDPIGSFIPSGYGIYPLYFGEALKNLGIDVKIYRAGAYKSAVEPFSRTDMSDEAKEATLSLLEDLWSSFLTRTALSRSMSPEDMESKITDIVSTIENQNGSVPQALLFSGFIDTIKTAQDFETELNTSGPTVSFTNYLDSLPEDWSITSQHIAVVVAEGTVAAGEQPAGIAGGETIARHIRKAGQNPNTKAIVLRLDTPGGSMFGSDIVAREVIAIRKKGIPVIASMGSYAASGGYWMAAAADEIFAQGETITGAIGVFSVIPTGQNALAKLGIYTDGVGTSSLANGINPLSGMPDDWDRVLQATTQNAYDTFVNHIAENRSMSKQDVLDAANGRVWSGKDAFSLNLVDSIGGLDKAVARAAEMANIENWSVVYVEDKASFFDQLVFDLFAFQTSQETNTLSNYVKGQLNRLAPYLMMLRQAGNVQAYCEVCNVR